MHSRHSMSSSLIALFALLAFCTACAGRLPPLHSTGQPFTVASDEALIWERATEEHRKLRNSPSVLRDPVLEEYLTDVARRLVPPGAQDAGVSVSVHVLTNPSLNAFAYPTGAIYVHSGLLAQLENEAQLAAVLSHEIAHVIHRHTIRHLRQERSKDLWKRLALVTSPLVLGPVLAPLGVTVGGGVNPAILLQRPTVEELLQEEALDTALALSTSSGRAGRRQRGTAAYARGQPPLALVASVRKYSTAMLQEADRFAVEAMTQAGYDPHEAERTRELLHGVAGAQQAQEPFWWGQPRVYEARSVWIRQALAQQPSTVDDRRALAQPDRRFQQHTWRLVRENALAELHNGRPAVAIAQLNRVVQWHAGDPVAHYYLGKAYAASASSPDGVRKAIDAYTQATQVDATFAHAYQALAHLHARGGDPERAVAARERYIALRGELSRLQFPNPYDFMNQDPTSLSSPASGLPRHPARAGQRTFQPVVPGSGEAAPSPRREQQPE